MKICPTCGASNSDSFKFCLSCGERLDTVPSTEQPAAEVPAPVAEPSYEKASAPDYSYASYSVPTVGGCGSTLNDIMSSNSVLAAAILLTVSYVISVATLFLAKEAFSIVSQYLTQALAELYAQGLLPAPTIEGILSAYGVNASQFSGVKSISYRIDIGGLLVIIAAWITWGTARNGKTSKAGFIILKVIAIIGIVLSCIAAVALVAGSAVLAYYAFENLDAQLLAVFKTPIITAITLLAVFCVLCIIVEFSYARTYGSLSKACSGTYNGKISVVAGALLMYNGIHTIIFCFIGAAISSLLSPVFILGYASSVCSGIAYIICGYVLIKARTLLAEA